MHGAARGLRMYQCRNNCRMNVLIALPLIAGIVVFILWATKVIKFD